MVDHELLLNQLEVSFRLTGPSGPTLLFLYLEFTLLSNWPYTNIVILGRLTLLGSSQILCLSGFPVVSSPLKHVHSWYPSSQGRINYCTICTMAGAPAVGPRGQFMHFFAW